jgi:multicomponent Na+:H+ antiporter subunit D
VGFLDANPVARTLLIAAAAVSIVLGSLLAVAQEDLKRMLAYSSVSQFGLIVGAVAVANGTALTGAAIHLVGHAIMKGGLFLAAGSIATATGARTVTEFEGLSERLPGEGAAFGVLALGMVGVPPAVGFVGKWYVALGAVEAESWPLAAVIFLSTLLTLAYFARLIERMYFREPVGESPAATADAPVETAGVVADGRGTGVPSPGMRATVAVAAVLAVVLGALAVGYGELLDPTITDLLNT